MTITNTSRAPASRADRAIRSPQAGLGRGVDGAQYRNIGILMSEFEFGSRALTIGKGEPDVLEVEEAIKLVKESLDAAMRSGSYSLGFLIDLATVKAEGKIDWHRIVDEIAAMEGAGTVSTTKPEQPFKGKHLKGYWHKHHTQARYLPQNLANEMMVDDTIRRILHPHIGEDLTPQLLGRLTHALVVDGHNRRLRERRLTGEWILFAKSDRANYYLTLASHQEPDPIIAERLRRYEDLDRATSWAGKGSTVTKVFAAADP